MSDFKIFAITCVTQSESLLLDIKSRDALRVDEKKGTMTLIRNESYVRHGDEARFEEVKIVGEAPKIFSLNVHVETKNISWDSKNRVRFVLKNKDVVIIQFVSRFVARNAAEALSRLVSSSSSELKFTYPDDTAAKPKVSEITIFGGDGKSDENAFIFFEYPPLLGCSRDCSSLSNLRKIQVNEDRCPSFYSGKHFNSLVNAYETAGFSRVSKEQHDRWSAQYGSHFHEELSKWRTLKSWRTYSHIPGTAYISHKDVLARNMRAFRKNLADREQTEALKTVATPLTYVLPEDLKDLESAMKVQERAGSLKSTQWISKPYARSRGEGIELWNGETLTKELLPRLKTMIAKRAKEEEEKKEEEETKEVEMKTRFMKFVEKRRGRQAEKRAEDETAVVVQSYISRPFLVDNLKFDCRVYVVATSLDPISLWLYEDGLGRFATTPYSEKNAKNVSDMFVHLTNSSVNKHSDRYELNTGTSKAEMEKGSKRSLKATFRQMGQAGLDVKLARKRMCDVLLRVFMAYEQTLREASRCISNTFHKDGSGCYELFGADVMFRADGTPVVLEINYSPQIDAPMPMDQWIKGRLLADTLHLAGHRVPPSKIEEETDDDDDDDTKVPVCEHEDYKRYFRLLKVLPTGAVKKRMLMERLNPDMLSTPNKRISSETLSQRAKRLNVGPLPSSEFAKDDDVDSYWLSNLKDLRTRAKNANFECIFPVSSEQVSESADLFPTKEARDRYASLAKKMS